ncbi:MAG TPA: uroporphyrinogen-III synthase [Blastocatellia bacterium]|nr:uroporphyrinogen-III synthase [Blastocatellia bacterium]
MGKEEDSKRLQHGLPLLGKTVVVTRARAQSAEITHRLEAYGATVIHCATIEAAPPSSWVALDEAIQRLANYDWLVFTSANGVEFFFRRLREKRTGSDHQPAAQIVCAIGPATAQALKAEDAPANVVASESSAEGALASIIDYVGGPERVRGLNFLIPRAQVAREVLPDGLRRLGARVDAVEAYQTIKPDIEAETIRGLFKEQSIDAITFTSSSTVSNLAALVGLEDLSGLLANTVAVCIGPVTAETALKHGVARIVHPHEYNTESLVDSIVQSIGRP